MIDPQDVEHIPPRAASTYIKLASEYGREYYRSVADLVARRPRPAGRLLDAGTGPGLLPLAIAARSGTPQIDAFDFTRELVQYGRTQAIERGVNDRISFFVADCYAIPTAGTNYPLLTCTGVLHALDHPVQALSEFYRVLEPGGEAWVFDPVIIDLPDELDVDFTPHEWNVFDSYGVRADRDEPTISADEAFRLVDATPFESVEVEEGERAEIRLYLRREE